MSHLTLAVTTDGLDAILWRVSKEFQITVPQGNWVNLGPLRLRLGECRAHLENGSFEVIDPAIGGIRGQIKEIDVVWDKLDVHLGIDIPETCVGGFCILPSPWGCVVKAPRKCFFKGNPDLWGTLPLAGLRNEFSTGVSIKAKQVPGSWDLLLKPEMPLDIDFVDMPDMVGDILDKIVDILIDDLLSFLPSWARDLVKAVLGSLTKLIRKLLDVGDDVMEWIAEKLGVSLGFLNIVGSILIEVLFVPKPIASIEDPQVLMESELGPPALPAVTADIDVVDASFKKVPDRLELSITLTPP